MTDRLGYGVKGFNRRYALGHWGVCWIRDCLLEEGFSVDPVKSPEEAVAEFYSDREEYFDEYDLRLTGKTYPEIRLEVKTSGTQWWTGLEDLELKKPLVCQCTGFDRRPVAERPLAYVEVSKKAAMTLRQPAAWVVWTHTRPSWGRRKPPDQGWCYTCPRELLASWEELVDHLALWLLDRWMP